MTYNSSVLRPTFGLFLVHFLVVNDALVPLDSALILRPFRLEQERPFLRPRSCGTI